MRIRRLDLIRYGRFTDAALDLPPRSPDLHIVYGPNEAGKSTAMAAIEDLLFGIPRTSPLDFIHEYRSMRVGAVVEANGSSLELRRRKGRRGTLLSPNETALPGGEAALAPFLGSVDRDFLRRMFSLDHQRLREGGREILEAKDEIGQVLFSVGAGIRDLHGRLTALEREADELWSARRSAKRKYYPAEDRLKEAQRNLRELTVSAERWRTLQRECAQYEAAHAKLQEEIQRRDAELAKVGRIRRVIRPINDKARLEAQIAALGEVPTLPADAREALDAAERDEALAQDRLDRLHESLALLRDERRKLTRNESPPLPADDIQELHRLRIQVGAEQRDLPKRQAELRVAETSLLSRAKEIEWDTADVDGVMQAIPPRPKVARIRDLLQQRAERQLRLAAARKAAEEADARQTALGEQIEATEAPANVARLGALVNTLSNERGDIASRIRDAEADAREAGMLIAARLARMAPPVADMEAAAAITPPPLDAVRAHRDRQRDLEQRLDSLRNRVSDAKANLSRKRSERDLIVRLEQPVPLGELTQLRARRDAGWHLVRSRYIEGRPVADADIAGFVENHAGIAAAYEAAVLGADEAADQRVATLEAEARLAVAVRQVAEGENELATLREELGRLKVQAASLAQEWLRLWKGAPFQPLSPAAMEQWLADRAELLQLAERRDRAARRSAELRRLEREAVAQLENELRAVGFDASPLRQDPLRLVLEAASDVHRDHQLRAEAHRKLASEMRHGADDANQKRQALQSAAAAVQAWALDWATSVAELGLGSEARPEVVQSRLDVIEEMRDAAARIRGLRIERIDKIRQDIEDFRAAVADTVRAIAPDLAGKPAEDAVVELERRAQIEQERRNLQRVKGRDIKAQEAKIDKSSAHLLQARTTIRRLEASAGVQSREALREAIANADQLRQLSGELAAVAERLRQDGDGLSIAELAEECRAADPDQLSARETALKAELQELRPEQLQTRDRLQETRTAFQAVGGEGTAANAEADRQSALAEIEQISASYVRVRTAALMLRWVIDRFRREKQAPMLKRAGGLFSDLTGGSFQSLQLDFDDRDRAHLVGLRPDGGRIGVAGLSTGTADQLYLALRIAAVEDYLGGAQPLPFVADDLFINFDDERAAAGLRTLADFARRCQVLFFTHHEHLVEIARRTLQPSVPVLTLAPAKLSG